MILKEMWIKAKSDAKCDILLVHVNDYYFAFFDDIDIVKKNFRHYRAVRKPICSVALHKDYLLEAYLLFKAKGIKVGFDWKG